MEKHYQIQLNKVSEMMLKDENMKNEICKTIIKEAKEKNIRICKLLEELPSIIEWGVGIQVYEVQYEMNKPKDIEKFANIEYVGMISKPYALCGSVVILRINGQEIEFDNILSSGGYVSWGKEGDIIESGPWTVESLPEYLEKYEKEITKIINDNISWGCCGGCI